MTEALTAVPVPPAAPASPEPNGGAQATPPIPAADPASVFGALRQRAAVKALPFGYMSAEEKDTAWRLATPFWLVDVVDDNGQFGARLNFIVVANPALAPNGEYDAENAKAISLDLSNFRAALADECRALLPTAKVLGPVYLTKFRTRNNRTAWDIAEVPQEGQVVAEITQLEASGEVVGGTQSGNV